MTSFCPVSGSPIINGDKFLISLPSTNGTTNNGSIYHCCQPCICDIKDASDMLLLKTHEKQVELKDGLSTFNFLVINDPCSKKIRLTEETPDIVCKNGKLEGAQYIGDKVIIGLFDSTTDNGTLFPTDFCNDRKRNNYNSGMGNIFRNVVGLL